MKNTAMKLALAVTLSSTAFGAQAYTITWGSNTSPTNPFPSSSALTTTAFAPGNDFRLISPINGLSYGGGEKAMASGVSWVFDDSTGDLISVTGSDVTTGAPLYATQEGVTSAAPAGDIGLFKNTPFLNIPWGFLAPTVGSAAGNAYGVGHLTTAGDAITIFFPVLEAQWYGTHMTIGLHSGGVYFNCTGRTTGNIACTADELTTHLDETVGFGGSVAQWDLKGTAVPVPAALWLLGSGLMGLVGVARRKQAA